jgi:hypothetical protein
MEWESPFICVSEKLRRGWSAVLFVQTTTLIMSMGFGRDIYCAAIQEHFLLSWNPETQSPVHNTSPLVSNLSLLCAARTVMLRLYVVNFNIMSPSTSRF